MNRLLLLLVAILASSVPAVLAQTPAADTGLGIRLLEAPTDRRDDPRAQVYIIDHVAPGSTFTRRLEVVNDTAEPLEVSLYGVGSELQDGSFAPLPGRTPNELSTWLSVTPEQVTLGPRERQTATVTVAVPADASEGERYAAVMAESSAADASGVVVNTRVGIRVYLSVGPGGEPASDFTIDALTAARDEQGNPVVEASVTNTGGRALDMGGTLSLTDGPGGLSAGPFPAELGATLGVGQTESVRIVLDSALPAGPWAARIDLKSGLLERAAEGVITFPEAAGEVGPPVAADPVPLGKNWAFLVPLAIGLLVLAALALLWLLRRQARLRRLREQAQTPAAEPRSSSDDEVVRS